MQLLLCEGGSGWWLSVFGGGGGGVECGGGGQKRRSNTPSGHPIKIACLQYASYSLTITYTHKDHELAFVLKTYEFHMLM